MRYLLLDRITDIKYDSYANGVKCVSLSEDFLEYHFPMNPIFPGALTIESLAQLCGWLIHFSLHEKNKYNHFAILTKVERMKFNHIVTPGDRLELYAELDGIQENCAFCHVKAKSGDTVTASGKLMFVITTINEKESAYLRDMAQILTKNMKVHS